MSKRYVSVGVVTVIALFFGYVWVFEPEQGRCGLGLLVEPGALSYHCRGAVPEEVLAEWRAVEYARQRRRGICPGETDKEN